MDWASLAVGIAVGFGAIAVFNTVLVILLGALDE